MREDAGRSINTVIAAMRDDPGNKFTIDELARIAMFSKFHFSRVFQDVTGTSPGRFLAAVRLAEAKRLLLATSLSVADISIQVGYASVGTFSTRFKFSVGVAPSAFRNSGGFRPRDAGEGRRGGGPGTVWGEVTAADETACEPVFVGLFPDVIPEGVPVRGAVLRRPGPFRLDRVPSGTWYLLAHCPFRPSVPATQRDPGAVPGQLVAAQGPLAIRTGPEPEPEGRNLRLRSPRPSDLPILLAPVCPAPTGPSAPAASAPDTGDPHQHPHRRPARRRRSIAGSTPS
jgi:AraC family transcriptional regulator